MSMRNSGVHKSKVLGMLLTNEESDVVRGDFDLADTSARSP